MKHTKVLVFSVLFNIVLILSFYWYVTSTQTQDGGKKAVIQQTIDPLDPVSLLESDEICDKINGITDLSSFSTIYEEISPNTINEVLDDKNCSPKKSLVSLLQNVDDFEDYKNIKRFYLIDDGAAYMIFLQKNYSALSKNIENILSYEGDLRSYKYIDSGLTKKDFLDSHSDLVKYTSGAVTKNFIDEANGNDIYVYIANPQDNTRDEMKALCTELGIDGTKCIELIDFAQSDTYEECIAKIDEDSEQLQMCYKYL